MNTCKKRIFLNNKKIYYQIKESNRAKKNVRLKVDCDGNIFLIIPKKFSVKVAERFLFDKKEWILKKLSFLSENKKNIFFKKSDKDYFRQKKVAKKIIESRISYYSRKYNFKFGKISVRNQKTRWGSCSSKGNLSFNFRVVYLTRKQLDYIVVHELCHLKEFNHSDDFWKLVGKIVPDYKKIKKEIKKIAF